MIEALQVLKFNHRSNPLDFSSHFGDNLKDLEAVAYDEIVDEELQEEVHHAQGGREN